MSQKTLLTWLELSPSKFHDWAKRYGKANEHNGKIPRDYWLENWERQAIIGFHHKHPLNGYRRLTFMMNDADVVAVSPSTTYRVLKNAGLLDRHNVKASKKGTGFKQPEKHPGAKPRIISDNGPQFIAKDFKVFLRILGLSHARTSPYCPQSNGKLERWHGTIKNECIRPSSPQTVEEALKRVRDYVEHYNEARLHSAIGYVTPADKLAGRAEAIQSVRDQRLEAARERRRQKRQQSVGA